MEALQASTGSSRTTEASGRASQTPHKHHRTAKVSATRATKPTPATGSAAPVTKVVQHRIPIGHPGAHNGHVVLPDTHKGS